MVRGELEDKYDFRRVEVVGPAVSGDLTVTSTIGVVLAMAAIMIYIWVRFEWQFALGAVISMVHDVVFTIGLFVFLDIEFNLTSIAAILTIIGYSLNDTVVIYDRVRENLRRYKKMPLSMIIDASLNQTLSRTILTGLTVLLALLALYLFGGEVIRSFTFAMLFGVGIGVFSSVYIAAPVLIAFKLRPIARMRRTRRTKSPVTPSAASLPSDGRRDRNTPGPFSWPGAHRCLWQWRISLRRYVASRLSSPPAFRHLRVGARRPDGVRS